MYCGTGGILHDSYFVGSLEMTYQNHLFKFDQFFSMDFSGIKSALKAKGEKGEFHGISGFGFFKQTKCFIDYAGERIFFKA
jgi:hypothetical protein